MPTDHEPNRQTVEFLLSRAADRIDKLESALEKNWLVHAVLAGVGIALVLHTGDLQEFLSDYLTHGKYEPKPVSAVIMAVFLYYFMKLGHLVTSFNEVKCFQEVLLRDYLAGQEYADSIGPLRRTTNFFAESFRPGKGGVPFVAVATFTVSAAQASAFFLVFQAYGLKSAGAVCGLAFCVTAILTLYYLFVKEKSQLERDRAKLVVVLNIVFTVIGLVVFAIIAPSSPLSGQ